MSKQPKLELIYFNLRALAESPQMMMHYAGVKYRYEMAWDYSNKHKDYYKSLTIEENPLWKDFEEEAKNSFSKKNELENNDKRLFEEFVESYFSE